MYVEYKIIYSPHCVVGFFFLLRHNPILILILTTTPPRSFFLTTTTTTTTTTTKQHNTMWETLQTWMRQQQHNKTQCGKHSEYNSTTKQNKHVCVGVLLLRGRRGAFRTSIDVCGSMAPGTPLRFLVAGAMLCCESVANSGVFATLAFFGCCKNHVNTNVLARFFGFEGKKTQ